MKHANVALFVPHNGCPHQCSFCNQKSITGRAKQPSPADVRAAAERASETLGPGCSAELAFFGGSFTAVEPTYMVSLLEAARPYVESGWFSGIRISTRPDCVGRNVLSLLWAYGVRSIELGAQSMREDVLYLNRRGRKALLVGSGLKTGLNILIDSPRLAPMGTSPHRIESLHANAFINNTNRNIFDR